MGGDLNLKKSWHPHLKKNQERVWKEEKSALDERKLIEKLRREREEERATEELQRLQAENGGKVVTKRVDWMYNGTTDGDGALGDDREAYLLGKRRIDNLLKSDTQSLQKGAAVGIDAVGDPNANANTARDTQKKVLQDPLLMIQKQKMEMQLKAMKTAQKEAQYKEKREKEKDRERKHSHKHRDRERSRDREHKHRSRHDRDRSRSRSPRRRGDRDSYRRRSKSRSRSPYRKREDREDVRDRDRDRGNYHRLDRSPRRRSGYSEKQDGRKHPGDTRKDDDKAERLAQMQAEAASLEKERAERVREHEIKDAEEEEKHKKSRDGARFISGVRGQAANMDLGDAIARGRQNHRAEVDALEH